MRGSYSRAARLLVPQNIVDNAQLSGRCFVGSAMCFGVFVQMNEGSRWAWKYPIGYVIQENGCWEWVGSINKGGHGTLWWKRSEGYIAYRMMYETHKGAIPDGLELDHLCRNRLCVNPDHLEAVTHEVNIKRGNAPNLVAHRTGVCKRGHRDWMRIQGANRCRSCVAIMTAKRKAKQRPQHREAK